MTTRKHSSAKLLFKDESDLKTVYEIFGGENEGSGMFYANEIHHDCNGV